MVAKNIYYMERSGMQNTEVMTDASSKILIIFTYKPN